MGHERQRRLLVCLALLLVGVCALTPASRLYRRPGPGGIRVREASRHRGPVIFVAAAVVATYAHQTQPGTGTRDGTIQLAGYSGVATDLLRLDANDAGNAVVETR